MLRMRGGDVDHIHAVIVHDLWYDPCARARPCSVAKAWARSVDRLATATASAPATYGKSLITRDAMRPGPMIPHERSVNRSSVAAPPLPHVAGDRGDEDRDEHQPPIAPAGGKAEQDDRQPGAGGDGSQHGVRLARTGTTGCTWRGIPGLAAGVRCQGGISKELCGLLPRRRLVRGGVRGRWRPRLRHRRTTASSDAVFAFSARLIRSSNSDESIRPCAMCSCRKVTAWSRSASPIRGSTGRFSGVPGWC